MNRRWFLGLLGAAAAAPIAAKLVKALPPTPQVAILDTTASNGFTVHEASMTGSEIILRQQAASVQFGRSVEALRAEARKHLEACYGDQWDRITFQTLSGRHADPLKLNRIIQ